MAENKRILFLYTELAEYFVSALRVASAEKNVEIKVVHWPVNKEAPFQFNFPKEVEFVDKSSVTNSSLQAFVADFEPHTIVCSGWIDKDYLKICKTNFKKSTTVVSLDNHWKGSFKQKILTIISPFYLKRIFKNAWVPGKKQLEYAHKLGFKNAKEHFYVPNIEFYKNCYFPGKIKPKRFLYIGRYVEHKGIFELWEAFKQLHKEFPNDWELWCLGTGDKFENRIQHDKVKHFGFVQPEELAYYIKETMVFVLPSKFEPWGVVVQEMAAAGMPLLLSDKVGSKESFLSAKNGFSFNGNSIQELKEALCKTINLSDDDLLRMSEESYKLAQAVNQKQWTKVLLGF